MTRVRVELRSCNQDCRKTTLLPFQRRSQKCGLTVVYIIPDQMLWLSVLCIIVF